MKHFLTYCTFLIAGICLITTTACTHKKSSVSNGTSPSTAGEQAPNQPNAGTPSQDQNGVTDSSDEAQTANNNQLPESLKGEFDSCGAMRESFYGEINKYPLKQFSTRHELQVKNKDQHWAEIESNYPVSVLKVPADKDVLKELESFVKSQCKSTSTLTAEDGTVVQLFHCDEVNDAYIALKNIHDQMTRIYNVTILVPDNRRNSWLRIGELPQLLSVNSRPFLDTTAIYVRLLTIMSESSEYCCFGSSDSHDSSYGTLVFAGEKHRKIGHWEDTFVEKIENIDTPKGEETATEDCTYSFSEYTAVFDGQINANTTTNWSLENNFENNFVDE